MERFPFAFEGRKARTVLLVDTDTHVLRSFSDALRREGYAVLEATSFHDGKTLWARERPDVLIVDVRLGQFNGLQLLMRARADCPDLLAFITSPFRDTVLEAETRRFGGVFLTKPIEPGQIVRAVQSASVDQASVPEPFTPPMLIERRRTDRRVLTVPDFQPERRVSDRRSSGANVERRGDDRRKMEVPGFVPDRRVAPRRRPV